MWWKIIIFLAMAAVIVAAFLAPSPMNPSGSLGNPEVYRIFYFHVPQSWVAALAFLISMFYSIRFLQTRNMKYDINAVVACKLGLLFAILATLTGSIFAKMTWGEFWNWSEIREVSIFMLLVIYGAYFALRSALPEAETRATLSAVLSILFAMSAIFLIFVLPRIYSVFSQHPTNSIINDRGSLTMGPTVRIIFFSSLAAFTALFLWIYNLSLRVHKMIYERTTEN